MQAMILPGGTGLPGGGSQGPRPALSGSGLGALAHILPGLLGYTRPPPAHFFGWFIEAHV